MGTLVQNILKWQVLKLENVFMSESYCRQSFLKIAKGLLFVFVVAILYFCLPLMISESTLNLIDISDAKSRCDFLQVAFLLLLLFFFLLFVCDFVHSV